MIALAAISANPAPAADWNMPGAHRILLQTRDGKALPIGTVIFAPKDGRTAYDIRLDHARLTSYFLSMRGFECVAGEDVQCYVPYPYAHPHLVTASDLRWLEHDLMFLTKSSREFGARLENGVYYRLAIGPGGLQGRPEDIDLDRIASPPDDPDTPPYAPADREPTVRTRWITGLLIEAATTP